VAFPTESAALVAQILADPPRVHEAAPSGVWSTERQCYEFLATNVGPETRSLETGCGVSTAVFAVRQAKHVCVMPFTEEADIVNAWCDRLQVPRDHLSFEIGPSDAVLPRMEATPLDLIFVDGDHRFPSPLIDWYFTIKRLVPGGLIVFDDIQLQGPKLIADYVATLVPFESAARTAKWTAFRLAEEVPPPEEWPLPRTDDVLIPGGYFERLGRKVDRRLRRIRAHAD
jgi:hypothetical protein